MRLLLSRQGVLCYTENVIDADEKGDQLRGICKMLNVVRLVKAKSLLLNKVIHYIILNVISFECSKKWKFLNSPSEIISFHTNKFQDVLFK